MLTAALDLTSGGVAAWAATAGRAGVADLGPVLAAAGYPGASTVRTTRAVHSVVAEAIGAARDGPSPVRAGGALVAALGDRVARVRLLPQAIAERPDPRLPLVSLEDVRSVLALTLPTHPPL